MTCPASEYLTLRTSAGIVGHGFMRCLLPEGHDGAHETVLPTILPDGGKPHLFLEDAQKSPPTP